MEFGRSVGVVLLVCLSLFSCSTEGYRFNVGGRDGWVVNPSENYSQWAQRNRFRVNDTLYFKYNKGSDSVLEVNKDDFFNCNTNNPILKLDGGNSEFTFKQSGPYYFISGQNGNCAKGQKLVVNVLAVRRRKQPTPSPALPPSAAPSPATPTIPSPQLPPSQPPMASPPKGLAPGGPIPSSPSPSPVNPPAASPAPWSSPSMSPVPAPSTGTTTPATSPVNPPILSPPSPTPMGSTPTSPSAEPPTATPPGNVNAPPPPGSDNSTAPGPSGNGGSRSVTTPSGVLVSWVVGLVSLTLMSSLK